ncbi:MAG: phosphonate C-P lyase system protein PhnG [Thermodesulfobacteriota bacterium]
MSDYQHLIINLEPHYLNKLGKLLAKEEIEVLQAPKTGLLMMVAQDPFAQDFCLGEILITEAETEYQGHRGYAMILGEDPDRAVMAAAVAAVFQSNNDVLQQKIDQFLAPLASALRQEAEWERRLLAKTLVSFESMVKG